MRVGRRTIQRTDTDKDEHADGGQTCNGRGCPLNLISLFYCLVDLLLLP